MYNILEIILKKYLQSLINRRYGINHIIQFVKEDKTTPWHVFSLSSKSTYKVSSYKEAYIIPSNYRVGSVDLNTEKEIIVWMRLQPNPIKEDITSQVSARFRLPKVEADRLFYRAFPDYLSDDEISKVHKLQEDINFSLDDIAELNAVLDYLSGSGSLQECNMDPYTMYYMNIVVNELLQERFLVP